MIQDVGKSAFKSQAPAFMQGDNLSQHPGRGTAKAFTSSVRTSPVAASLEFKGELKRWPMLSVVCDKECLVLFHRLCQLHKISLRELSRQEICPAIRLHCILHHSLVVIGRKHSACGTDVHSLLEECMRRIGLHHHAFAGLIHLPLSRALAVPGPNSQSAFQYIEKTRKWVLMAWNTHARHDRCLINGEGVARGFSPSALHKQPYRPDIQRRASRFVVLNNVVYE